MSSCCVPGCKNNNRDVNMHVLPKDKETRKKWCEAIGREDLIEVEVKKSQRICRSHFHEDCILPDNKNRSSLRRDSIPSLNLPNFNVSKSYVNNVTQDPNI